MVAEKVAIIDLGTNTFHLLIAEITEREEILVRERFKEPVKLGEGGITSGKIADRPFKRGISVLKKFRQIINSRGVSKVFAFATSAIRGAANGAEFIQTAHDVAQIDIKVINGNEEAALIFEGVSNGVQLPYSDYSLILDIGGGSVEFIVAYENRTQLLRSLDIGAARILETIKPSDPMTDKDIKAVEKLLEKEVGPLIKELKEFPIEILVGSSGTFETLGALVAHSRGDRLSLGNLNSYEFSRTSFRKIHKKLIASNRKDRLKMGGMEPMRVDMILMGSLVVNYVLDNLGIKKIQISLLALKEGILHRFLEERRNKIAHIIGKKDKRLRAKAVTKLGDKYKYDRDHGIKVSEIASKIFDQLAAFHNFGERERELLTYAALLHDIGSFMNRSGHHKHGQYIIMHSGLEGFSNDELVVLGNIVRYHRKNFPTRDHMHYKILPQPERDAVRLMAGILRISDHLDRGHRHLVSDVKVSNGNKKIKIKVQAPKPLDIEIPAAMGQKELLEQVLGMKIEISQD